jgi:hypothetical protein
MEARPVDLRIGILIMATAPVEEESPYPAHIDQATGDVRTQRLCGGVC